MNNLSLDPPLWLILSMDLLDWYQDILESPFMKTRKHFQSENHFLPLLRGYVSEMYGS